MGVIVFMVFLIIFLLFIEFFTLLFVNTGLPYDKARFQVISMLTSVGYTTKESEHISSHKRRRKIASWVMILGYVGNVTFVSFLIGLIASKKVPEVIILVLGIGAIVIFCIKSRNVMQLIDKCLSFIIKRKIFGGVYVKYKMLLEGKEYSIYTITLSHNNFLVGKSLLESRLMRDHEIQVLMVERNGHQINCPKPTYIFEEDDEITIYGKLKNIEELFLK
ncbi:cation:proton antiporter regulatory subunit [Clostridium sp.]|uniref:cation:proton antiporter regulatory subunit n=1 Tax=Clostridium sp. TaxID=1506 RepID=UPI003F36B54A